MSRWLVALLLSLLIPVAGFAAPAKASDTSTLPAWLQSLPDGSPMVDHATLDGAGPAAGEATVEAAADGLIDAPELLGSRAKLPLLTLPAGQPQRLDLPTRPAPVLEGLRRPPRASLR